MATMDRKRELMENIHGHMDNTLLQVEALERVARVEGHKELFDWTQKVKAQLGEWVKELA